MEDEQKTEEEFNSEDIEEIALKRAEEKSKEEIEAMIHDRETFSDKDIAKIEKIAEDRQNKVMNERFVPEFRKIQNSVGTLQTTFEKSMKQTNNIVDQQNISIESAQNDAKDAKLKSAFRMVFDNRIGFFFLLFTTGAMLSLFGYMATLESRWLNTAYWFFMFFLVYGTGCFVYFLTMIVYKVSVWLKKELKVKEDKKLTKELTATIEDMNRIKEEADKFIAQTVEDTKQKAKVIKKKVKKDED